MVLTFLGGKGRGDGPSASAEAFRALQQVRGYWEGLRGAKGAIPARSALDPRGLAPALDHVFVAEKIGTGLIRLRIAGMGLTDLAGLDMKGLPLSTIFLPEARLRLAEVIERVFALPLATELHLEAERTIGRPTLAGRLLLLPLTSTGGSCDLVLGCLKTVGEIGRAPRRFAIARVIEERLILPGMSPASAPAAPSLPTAAPAALPQMGLAEPPAARPTPAPASSHASSQARPVKGRPHLRLVHSAD
jgi:hypothetical protein